MDIREQIEQLRTQAGISGYHSLMAPAANTMEKLLAVYEAAKTFSESFYELDAMPSDEARTYAPLLDALAALDQTRLATVECQDCGERVEDIQTHCEREDNICLVRAPERQNPDLTE